MKHDVRKSVWDAAEACRVIQTFTAGRTLETYLTDQMLRSAVERQFEILGEALKRVRDAEPAFYEGFPEMRAVIGMRDRIAHGYDVVDDNIVLRAASQDIPPLMAKLEAWL
jgi:uncharacterized protein with HEPN domain